MVNLEIYDADKVDELIAGVKPIPYLAGVPMYIYGDSYTQYFPPTGTPGELLARGHNMTPAVNRGIGGTRTKQFFERIEATWVPNTSGLVLIGSCLNNVHEYPATAQGYRTGAESFRACLAYLSDRSVSPLSNGGNVVIGSGSFDSNGFWNGAAGDHLDIAWNSNELDIFCSFVSGAGNGGVIQFQNESNQVLATVDTSGFYEDIVGVITIPSQGAGAHTVRGTVVSGNVVLRKIGARAGTPTQIVWDKPGFVDHVMYPDSEVEESWTHMVPVAESFPNVIISDSNVPGWNRATMTSDDDVHRNSRGNWFAYTILEQAIRDEITDFKQGLNSDRTYTADALHISPPVDYQKVGATVPSAPVVTAVTGNQVKITWTRPNDGGATIKGYFIQKSPAGANTWTDVTTLNTAAQLSYLVISDLTQDSNYDFRVRAFNDVGNSGFGTASAVAGPPVTYYGRDHFEKPDDPMSMGTAQVGGLWGYDNGTFGIKNNRGYAVPGRTVTTRFMFASLNTGQAQGYVEAVYTKLDSVAGGIILNQNLLNNPTQGLLLYNYGNEYRLSAFVASATFALLATYPVVPVAGDRIGLYHSGLNYYAVINGVVQPVFVGNTDYTFTRHGVFAWQDGEWDDFTHTNFDPRV